MNHTVLLIVDVQTALVESHPYHEEQFICNIKKLIEAARTGGMEVVYVCHDDGKGGELESGSRGWQVEKCISPLKTEKIFEKKYNSAFKESELKVYLEAKGIKNIILAGMQTEYCIDATCKSAFEQGYVLTIPEGCTTTFDNEYFSAEKLVSYYEKKIWNGRFARVIPIEEVLGEMLLKEN